MSDITPYNEDTIVSQWTKIHNIRIQLGIIDPKFIKFAPSTGHEIDYSQVSTIELDDRVRRLLKRLPHPSNEYLTASAQLLMHTTTFSSYLSGRDVALRRDANRFSFNFNDIETLDLLNVLPSDVVLSQDEEVEGFWMILDTQDNTIRSPSMEDLYKRHYREVRSEAAPVVLERILQRYKNLEFLPDGLGEGGLLFPDEMERLQPILRERYHWPDDFKANEWKRDMQQILDEIKN